MIFSIPFDCIFYFSLAVDLTLILLLISIIVKTKTNFRDYMSVKR